MWVGEFECQRHSNGSAKGADGDGVWDSGRRYLLPSGGAVWEGGCDPS